MAPVIVFVDTFGWYYSLEAWRTPSGSHMGSADVISRPCGDFNSIQSLLPLSCGLAHFHHLRIQIWG